VKAKTRLDGGLLNVNVLFALMVLVKKLPKEQSMSRTATAVKLPRTGPSWSAVAIVAVPVNVGVASEVPEGSVTVPVNVGDTSGATPVSVLLEIEIVLLLTVCVFAAVRTFDGVMILDKAAITSFLY
jgi:hypothetical protein